MTANHIIGRVYIGGQEDCPSWHGLRLNVMLPHQVCRVPFCWPMKALDPELDAQGFGVRFPKENLDAIADQMAKMLSENPNRDLLVHCWSGIERAPLSVAWWYARTTRDFDSAYEMVLRNRPQAQPRKHWIA